MKAILLIALIASAFATTDFSEFKKIEKRELGKTLMNTIAIQLTAGEPLEHLFDMLFTLEHRYQEDQKEDDANNRSFQDACDSDLKDLNREIAESEAKSTDLQGVLDTLHPERDQKEGSRKAKVISREQVQAVVDEATSQRSGEADTFEKKRLEYEYVSARLQEARRIFDENLVAFVQNGKVNHGLVMAQVEKVLSASPAKLSNLVYAVHYGKAIKMLAQLAGRNKQVLANQELTGKVVKLIEDLQNQMYQAFDLERKTEDDRVGAFNKYVALLQKDINKYNSDIANLEAEIASLDDRIAATQASKDDTDQRTEDKTTQRDDRRAECDQATYDYQQRRLNRDSDRQTVSDLIGLLNSKMRELREYIALRTAAGEY